MVSCAVIKPAVQSGVLEMSGKRKEKQSFPPPCSVLKGPGLSEFVQEDNSDCCGEGLLSRTFS